MTYCFTDRSSNDTTLYERYYYAYHDAHHQPSSSFTLGQFTGFPLIRIDPKVRYIAGVAVG